MADTKFISDIAAFCKRNNSLLIVDEIQSGFYRTGTAFACEHFALVPDIICLGKGVSSSLPLSVVAGRKYIFDRTSELEIITTHSTNPVSCAAAIANIHYLESETFQSHLCEVMNDFQKAIERIRRMHPNILDGESFGMVASLRMKEGNKPNSKLAKALVSGCYNHGLLLNAPNGVYSSYVRMTPPLTISRDNLLKGFEIMEDVLHQLQ